MPVVKIKRDPDFLSDEDLMKISKLLMKVVSANLNIPNEIDGKLLPGDIEIWPEDIHPLAVNNQPLEIMIFAQDFPARRANVDARAKAIAKKISLSLPEKLLKLGNKSGFVWIFLGQTGFAKFV